MKETAPICMTCGRVKRRVGSAIFEDGRSAPLYRCDGYTRERCDHVPKTRELARGGIVIGVIVNGMAYTLIESGLRMVNHPDDLWG